MKNLLFISVLFLMFSCFPEQDIIPPVITVTPTDSILEISSISNVTYNIEGFGNEDLTTFKINTSPFVYTMDTVFGTFTHKINYVAEISIPDILPDLGEDSLITVSFELSDNFNTTSEIRYLKVISGYGNISEDSTVLSYEKDSTMFYSISNKNLLVFNDLTLKNFDLVLIYDATDGFVLASPDAFYISDKLNYLGLSYSASDRNKTKINSMSTEFNLVDAKFLYYLTVSGAYINDDEGKGNGIADIQNDDVIAFETNSEKKGIIHVTNVDVATKKLSFEIKVQL